VAREAVHLTWREWIVRRFCELAVFLAASVALWRAIDAHAHFSPMLVFVQVLIYASVFLYLPLSAALWFVTTATGRLLAGRLLDSLLFILHSYAAMSLMHDGLLGITRHIDVLAASIGPWLAVVAWNMTLSAWTLVGARRGARAS
jgi:hypothetical protein